MYGQYNMNYFPLVTNPSESGIRSVKPITSIADMQKMKIRLGGVMAGKAAQKLGINITTVAASELYESLQRGVIDGGEFSGPKADDSLKLQEVAPVLVRSRLVSVCRRQRRHGEHGRLERAARGISDCLSRLPPASAAANSSPATFTTI